MTAVAKGDMEIVKLLLRNPLLNLNVLEPSTRTNAFWLACYYNRWNIMKILANAGIDIYN